MTEEEMEVFLNMQPEGTIFTCIPTPTGIADGGLPVAYRKSIAGMWRNVNRPDNMWSSEALSTAQRNGGRDFIWGVS